MAILTTLPGTSDGEVRALTPRPGTRNRATSHSHSTNELGFYQQLMVSTMSNHFLLGIWIWNG